MDEAAMTIIGVTVLVLLIGMMKTKAEILLKMLLRGILGCVCIYAFSEFLQTQNLVSTIAPCPLVFLTCAFLGIPGLFLLFAIHVLALF